MQYGLGGASRAYSPGEIVPETEYYANSISSAQVGKDTPFHEMASASQSVRELCTRISLLEDKLVGPVPTSQSKEAPTPPAVGLFGAIREEAVGVKRAVVEAMRALSRIEGALP